jgi:hypothetical protein
VERPRDGADDRAAGASEEAQKQGEEARVVETECSGLEYVEGEVAAEAGPLDELRDRYRLLKGQYEEKVGADALLALAKQNDDNAKEKRGRLAKLLSADITEEMVREHLAGLAELDTVDQVRATAETKANSLLGKRLSLESQINPARQALERAEEACKAFIMLAPLQWAPSTPELAEAGAATLEEEAKQHQSSAESEQALADEAKQVDELQAVLELMRRTIDDVDHRTVSLVRRGTQTISEDKPGW